MKHPIRSLVLLLLVSCTSTPHSDSGTGGNRIADSLVLDQVAEIVRTEPGRPVVVFDLDDTLFDARSRTLPILQEFAKLPSTKANYPEIAAKLLQARKEDLQYDLGRTFEGLSISDDEALKEAIAFWTPRFFSDKYCAIDEEISGASKYVKKIHGAGARVVYLSGRPIPEMKKGTLESLRKSGFPLGKNTELVLKPKMDMPDFEFKQSAMSKIAAMGKVVAAFENEPKNLNLMSEAFPKAVLVYLNTRHSNAPDKPTEESHWVKDYLPSPETP